MSAIPPEDLLQIGKVIRPHGLDGLLRIWPYTQSKETFLGVDTVFLQPDQGQIHEYRVLSAKPHKTIFLVRLDGMDSLDKAEKLRGAEILIHKNQLKREHEDEYFWFELIGLKVCLNTGRYMGVLQDIIATGSNDIYVVQEGEKEYLIPAIHDVVQKIDLKNKTMIIAEMEGLFDLNAV